jgi:dTDP-4-amino-4,6-dideoxygalactose transaminase
VYAVGIEQRDEAQNGLQAAGIGVGIHYPVPVHLQRAYASLGYGAGDFPITEALADQFLSLPIYAELRSEQISEVVKELDKVLLAEAA